MAGSENEPANSSSGESEESLSESETDKTSSKKTQPTSNSSSDESASESESDTGKTLYNPQSPDPNIKPLASIFPDDNQSKKSRSKGYSPPLLTGKRPTPENDYGDTKRVKTATVVAVAAPDAENCVEKKQLFQRLWSEDNEIELIQGMIDYVDEKGKDPLTDANDFYEFVKKSLHVDVNDKQVLTKARRLKKKFENNAVRVENNNGKVRSLSNPHEKKMYELSKNLWRNEGNKNVVMSGCNKKVKVKVNVTPKVNKSCKLSGSGGSGNGSVAIEVEPKVVELERGSYLDGLGSVGLPITDEVIMKKGLELLSGSKKVEMEEKWKNLKILELEHFMKKVDVLKEQAEIVLNAIAKSGAK